MSSGAEVRLLEKHVCDDLLVVRLSKPADYRFKAGQWFRLSLDPPEGNDVRTFSHASTPQDPHIEFATRISDSAFKQSLARLEPGATLRLVGPGGRLSLPEPADRAVFLVGGVGITPVRSLLRNSVQSGRRFEDAVVIYGNRSAECVAYADELAEMSTAGVRTVMVYEAPEPGWPGASGFITAGIVRHVVPDVGGRPFVVAGPPVMVSVMTTVLDDLGVPPERRTIEAFGASV